jgi:hypothetical protein
MSNDYNIYFGLRRETITALFCVQGEIGEIVPGRDQQKSTIGGFWKLMRNI